jgi:ferrous iron transport protein A
MLTVINGCELANANLRIVREGVFMNLFSAEIGKEYLVKDIQTNDDEIDSFLFTLGCYSGEPITVISKLKGGLIVAIKDGRYNIDKPLAEAITV